MRGSTFCDVEMLTTASITCSATSAMFSGPRAAAFHAGRMMIAAASAAMAGPRRTKRGKWQDMWPDMEGCAPESSIMKRVPSSRWRRKGH